jgi:hypothetical protein
MRSGHAFLRFIEAILAGLLVLGIASLAALMLAD